MRKLIAPVSLLLVSALHVAQGGCSSSSSLVGEGGCEAFCNKWVGARCRNSPTRETCLTECLEHRSRCRLEKNAALHCATIEGTIACETGSGLPKVIGCGATELELATCLGCDRFCEIWSTADCAKTPTRAGCVAFCQDARCSEAARQMLECTAIGITKSRPQCSSVNGEPSFTSCSSQLVRARQCAIQHGGAMPFDWLPPPAVERSEPDAGDAGKPDAVDTGAIAPGEDFDATGGFP